MTSRTREGRLLLSLIRGEGGDGGVQQIGNEGSSACPLVDNDLEPSTCMYSPVSAPLLAAVTRSPPLSMSANSASHFAARWPPLATISLGDQSSVSNGQEAQSSTVRWRALPLRVAHPAETG